MRLRPLPGYSSDVIRKQVERSLARVFGDLQTFLDFLDNNRNNVGDLDAVIKENENIQNPENCNLFVMAALENLEICTEKILRREVKKFMRLLQGHSLNLDTLKLLRSILFEDCILQQILIENGLQGNILDFVVSESFCKQSCSIP